MTGTDPHKPRLVVAAGYALGFAVLSAAQLQRGLDDPRFYVWGGVCEWAGYALVAALLGWSGQRIRNRRLAFAAPARDPWPPGWFQAAQALLIAGSAGLAAWIALDFAFAGIGRDQALFGLAGRRAGCVASLILLGATILMAWQTRGRPRACWQYAAFFSGVLFTSTLGWSSIAPPAAPGDGVGMWLPHGRSLAVSLAMMTLMTGLGLRRVLPRSSDWPDRGRRAMPAFAALALLVLALVLAVRLSG